MNVEELLRKRRRSTRKSILSNKNKNSRTRRTYNGEKYGLIVRPCKENSSVYMVLDRREN